MGRKLIPIAAAAVLLLVLTGYAAIALLSPNPEPQEAAQDSSDQQTRTASGKQALPGAGTEKTGKADQPRAASRSAPRQVAPDVIPIPPVDNGELERVEARAPLTPPKEEVSADPATWQIELLHQPAIPAAGRVLVGGHDIVIADINTLEPGQRCTDGADEGWHCGNMARTEFRAWVRGRALECRVPKEPLQGEITTSCSLGGQDLAEWLVQAGWARPIERRHFQEAAEFAEANSLGMFQPTPPTEESETDAPAGLY